MNKREIAGLVLIASLFFVWPIAHTITVRDLLILANVALYGHLAFRSGVFLNVVEAEKIGIVLLATTTAWMLIVALAISPEPRWSLGEMRGQWLKALLAFGAGLLAAAASCRSPDKARYGLYAILTALLIHVSFIVANAVQAYVQGNYMVRATGLTEAADKSSYVANLALAFFLAEWLARRREGSGHLPVRGRLFLFLFGVILLAVLASRSRNGIAVAGFMIAAAAVLWVFLGSATKKKRKDLRHSLCSGSS